MGRVIAIMNQKGGVGKTTTALNLGAALAERGARTLLVDLDPQANLTRGLGVGPGEVTSSIYDVLSEPRALLAEVVRPTKWDGLALAPSHLDLSGAEVEMVGMVARETRLKRALGALPDEYAFILIDCLPSLSLLSINAMVAAREIMVPMQAHPFALEGLGKFFEVFDLVRETLNPELKLSGVLLTMFDTRTNVSREVAEKLRTNPRIAPVIFRTVIRSNIRVAESQGAGVPVIHFDRRCAGAEGYRALAAEILGEAEEAAPPSAAEVPAPEPSAAVTADPPADGSVPPPEAQAAPR